MVELGIKIVVVQGSLYDACSALVPFCIVFAYVYLGK